MMRLFLKDWKKWEAFKALYSERVRQEKYVDLKLDLLRSKSDFDFIGVVGIDARCSFHEELWMSSSECLDWIANELQCYWSKIFDPSEPGRIDVRFKAVEAE